MTPCQRADWRQAGGTEPPPALLSRVLLIIPLWTVTEQRVRCSRVTMETCDPFYFSFTGRLFICYCPRLSSTVWIRLSQWIRGGGDEALLAWVELFPCTGNMTEWKYSAYSGNTNTEMFSWDIKMQQYKPGDLYISSFIGLYQPDQSHFVKVLSVNWVMNSSSSSQQVSLSYQ